MDKQPPDRQTLESKYQAARPAYESLARGLTEALSAFLTDEGIDVLSVESRVKEFDRFWDKIQRKGYKDPFEEVEDICGLRIVCYYKSDLGRISEIIHREFDVKESIDQAALLKPGEFGYLSLHFIVTVKEDWLEAPPFRGLGGLKAEIQVRTILMHAWAGISHKLAYKKKEHVPEEFQREFSRLSALFEIADERFDALRRDKEAYGTRAAAEAEESGRFRTDQEVNIDTLQALLDFYFPGNPKDPTATSALLDEIVHLDISMQELTQGIEKATEILPEIQKEQRARLAQAGWAPERIDFVFGSQAATLRTILELTNDGYVRYVRMKLPGEVADAVLSMTAKWRNKPADQSG